MLLLYLSLIDNEIDKRRFEELYYAYRKQMFVVAYSILKNKSDSEDVVHDVFYSIASRHLDIFQRITNEQDMKNYVLKATKNTALNAKRDREEYISVSGNNNIINLQQKLDDSEFLDKICEKETYDEILSAIKKLDKKYEEVLYQYFVLGLTTAEISECLGRDRETVKKQLSRGKSILLEILNVTEVSGV